MRKLATATAVSLILASSSAHALGLGDIEMRSALNQPMNAQIRLTAVRPGEADGMIVNLASADAFNRAGIERSEALTALQFSVDYSGSTPVIVVTSRSPVVEPFLNFLLEVEWPTGRMVREYTVLLDPPVFMTPESTQRNSQSDTPARVERGEQSLVTPVPIDRDGFMTGTQDFEFDEDSVVVVGSEQEISDDVYIGGSTGSAYDQDFGFGDEGEVISLTDLAAPNTDALLVTGLQPGKTQYDFPEVQLLGNESEVNNDFAVDRTQVTQVSETTDDYFTVEEFSGTAVDFGDLDDSDIMAVEEYSTQQGTSLQKGSGSFTPGEVTVKPTQKLGGYPGRGETSVQPGQTLGQVAEANRLPGVSAQQMLLALLNVNQDAFINNNVNLVVAGAVLRIPTTSEATRISQAEAIAQINEHNQLFREYRNGQRASATPKVWASRDDKGSSDSSSMGSAKSKVATAIADVKDKLRIVSGDEMVSSTGDLNLEKGTTAEKLGRINREMQIAREELASAQLKTEDLSEQLTSLEDTGDDLNTLVKLRQNEIAQLQNQLKGGSDNAAEKLNAAVDSAASKLGNTPDAELAANNPAFDEQVKAESESLLKRLLGDYGKFGLMGLLGLGLLGCVGFLIKRRRGTEEWSAGEDELEFMDEDGQPIFGAAAEAEAEIAREEEEASSLMGSLDEAEEELELPSFGEPSEDDFSAFDEPSEPTEAISDDAGDDFSGFDETAGESETFGDDVDSSSDSDGGSDDALSEIEVYLAYGLHSQAEESLLDLVAKHPDNATYAEKLLQTYQAQNNVGAFNTAAEDFKQRFGESNEYWASIVSMGNELEPSNELYSGGAEAVDAIGTGDLSAPAMDMDDFLSGDESTASSENREFGSEDGALSNDDDDPGMAFDEADLEATGEFDVESEDEGIDMIEFPGFESMEVADEAEAEEEPEAEIEAESDDAEIELEGGLEFSTDEEEADASLEFDGGIELDADTSEEDETSLDFDISAEAETDSDDDSGIDASLEFDGSIELSADDDALEFDMSDAATDDDDEVSSAEDLTLDLDQMTTDDLDGTEMLDNTESADLEIPDLTADNELLTGSGDADEMDTMLDLAKAYIDMGDNDSASSALDEIVKSGNPEQVSEAETLLSKIS